MGLCREARSKGRGLKTPLTDKRRDETPEELRHNSTYVAVTGRKWRDRGIWVEYKRAAGDWADVRAYDADDLELWLEHEPAVQVWFADILGLPATALKSPETYWRDWNRDVVPPITLDAVTASRSEEAAKFLAKLQDRKSGGTVVVHADSSDEAVAFSCAALIRASDARRSRAVVITDGRGWAAVSANSNIEIAIASQTVVAASAPSRKGLVVVIPVATGDNEAHFVGHRGLDIDPDICIQRTLPENFRDALTSMGIERGDAERLTIQCGRSWSVFRRIKNQNPALRQPTWHDQRYATALTTIALLGAYIEDDANDQKLVGELSGATYGEFAAEVEKLLRMDDAPVLRIGRVIKAKSGLELFKMNEAGIQPDMFERFLVLAETTLGQPNPVYDLPPDERWLASIKGKVRPISGVAFRSLADALGRVSVLAKSDEWRWKISQTVKNLLGVADKPRWLALEGVLRELSEAAPEEFLAALEADLRTPEPKVHALFEETYSGGLQGACVYADLLWALESLAWAPNKLLRVSRILAELTKATVKSSWSNSPSGSLLNIYRGWRPQTSATVEMRKLAVSALAKSHPDQAFSLCMGVLHRGHDIGFLTSRPKWRDDDAGSQSGVLDTEYFAILRHAADTAFGLAGHSVAKALELFERYNMFDDKDRNRTLDLLNAELEVCSVGERREIRKALRRKLHWELNHGGKKREGLPSVDLEAITDLYQKSEPADAIEKHQWLFENYYCELPERESGRMSQEGRDRVAVARREALQEIFAVLGFEGLLALATAAGPSNCVGAELMTIEINEQWLIEWSTEALAWHDAPDFLWVWLRSLQVAGRGDAVFKILDVGEKQLKWNSDLVVRFFSNLVCDPRTWNRLDEHPREIQSKYWNGLQGLPYGLDQADLKRGMDALLLVDNVSGALRSLRHREEEFEGALIADIMEKCFSSGAEALKEQQLYDLGELIDVMEKCTTLDRERLLQLEFRMTAAFGQFAAELMTELQREIATDPDQLFFVVTKVYRGDNAPKENLDEQDEHWSRACGHLLLYTKFIPGLERDGSFDERKFTEFTTHFLRKAAEERFSKGAQTALGNLLAFAPEIDGAWPPVSVCELLDQPDHDRLRSNFQLGVYNNRGVTMRSPYDGGDQERELAERYSAFAQRWEIEFPLASQAIREIADYYRRDATRQDRDAENSKERF